MNYSFEERENMLLPKAKNGDSIAQFRLGEFYLTADPPFQDDKKAFKWFTESSQRECYQACLEAGKMLLEGVGTKKNPKLAFELIHQSAKNYEIKAFLLLAELFKDGIGTEKNMEEAYIWTFRAAETEDERAYLPLAEYLLNGVGVERDLVAAADWAIRTDAKDMKALTLIIELIDRGVWHPDLRTSAYMRLAFNSDRLDRDTHRNWKTLVDKYRGVPKDDGLGMGLFALGKSPPPAPIQKGTPPKNPETSQGDPQYPSYGTQKDVAPKKRKTYKIVWPADMVWKIADDSACKDTGPIPNKSEADKSTEPAKQNKGQDTDNTPDKHKSGKDGHKDPKGKKTSDKSGHHKK
jgi:hypothetical protein